MLTKSEIATKDASKEIKPNDVSNEIIKLNYLDPKFVLECLSVPTHSGKEYRLVTYIMLWARRNSIKYEFDSYGNIYLTKGVLEEGEFYPCVTSHLDTVQDGQDPYIEAGVPLDIKIEEVRENDTTNHKLSVATVGSPIGIGADDKCGVCISLAMFSYFDKLKACFFLEEEKGCLGSEKMEVEWFKDVGYVIGYDSPELYRAAWSCSGVKLFSYDFYEKYMKEVCDKWGLVNCFYSEPYTDVKVIREKTDIICMNFGNGGWKAHSQYEYCIIEEMDNACGMGIDLIKKIGNTEHKLKSDSVLSKHSYVKNEDGTYTNTYVDDTAKLRSLGDNSKQTKYTSYSYTSSYNTTTSGTSLDTTLKSEIIKYIVSQYDTYIENAKNDIIENIKKLCEERKIDPSEFTALIENSFINEIKF